MLEVEMKMKEGLELKKDTKLVILGFDGLSTYLVDELVRRGSLPAIAQLINEGCYARAIPYLPAETGTNWATISTGAYPSTHGCHYVLHRLGDPLDKRVLGFSSDLCQAEQIWKAANKAGKRCVIFDYPQSYPLNINNVIHVGEDGCPSPSRREIASARGYLTEDTPKTINPRFAREYRSKIEVRHAKGWVNLPSDGHFLEAEIPIIPGSRSQVKEVKVLYLLVNPEQGSVSLHPEKNYGEILGEARLGEWSKWMKHEFRYKDKSITVAFRMKLLKLSKDGRNLHLYISQIYPTEGFTYPPELSKKLVEICGPYLHRPTVQGIVFSGACDIYVHNEELEYYSKWYIKAMEYVLSNYNWDLFMIKWHVPDYLSHCKYHVIAPEHPLYDPKRAQEGWNLWISQLRLGDMLVAKAIELSGDNAIIVVVSDHGETSVDPLEAKESEYASTLPAQVLEKEGLMVRDSAGNIDWSKTKAYAGAGGVWINVKGRDPQGIVETKEEYEELRDRIIEMLMDLKSPLSGKHLFNCVCRKEAARLYGIGTDGDPDILLLNLNTVEERKRKITLDEVKQKLPDLDIGTWEQPKIYTGEHNLDGVLIMRGPGLRKGYRRKKPVWLSYVAPTLCYLTGIPVPADADGGIIWDFLAP